MASRTAVINPAGDYEETVLRLARHLGRDRTRRAVFDLIYGKGSRPRSRKQIAEALGKADASQVVQNALDHLSKHGLIMRVENDGRVKDRSVWLYAKEESIRGLRKPILRFADDPAAAKKVATKRRPDLGIAKFSLVRPASRRTVKPTRAISRGPAAACRIAVLVTNPVQDGSLQTGVEFGYIEAGMAESIGAGQVELRPVLAPTFDRLVDLLNRFRPHVLHFSGHGGGRTLLLDNEHAGDDGGTVLDFDMTARVIAATSARLDLLVLVACDTLDGVERFLDTVPAVIAMAASIDDRAACAFSGRFYRSLAGSTSIAQALSQAKLLLEKRGFADADLPTLVTRGAGDADRVLIPARGPR